MGRPSDVAEYALLTVKGTSIKLGQDPEHATIHMDPESFWSSDSGSEQNPDPDPTTLNRDKNILISSSLAFLLQYSEEKKVKLGYFFINHRPRTHIFLYSFLAYLYKNIH